MLNKDGVFKEMIGRSGRKKGEFILFDGVVYNSNNYLFVFDYGNYCI